MRSAARSALGAVAVIAVVLAGCTGESADEPTPTASSTCLTSSCEEPTLPATPTPAPTTESTPTPTPTPSPTPSSTAAVAAEWAAPDPLTDEYMQLVLAELLQREVRVLEPVVRRAVEGLEPVVEDEDALLQDFGATRSPTHASAGLQTFLLNDAPTIADGFSDPVGPIEVEAVEIRAVKDRFDADGRCVVLLTTLDVSHYLNGGGVEDNWVRLLEAPGAANPTGWVTDNRVPVSDLELECL